MADDKQPSWFTAFLVRFETLEAKLVNLSTKVDNLSGEMDVKHEDALQKVQDLNVNLNNQIERFDAAESTQTEVIAGMQDNIDNLQTNIVSINTIVAKFENPPAAGDQLDVPPERGGGNPHSAGASPVEPKYDALVNSANTARNNQVADPGTSQRAGQPGTPRVHPPDRPGATPRGNQQANLPPEPGSNNTPANVQRNDQGNENHSDILNMDNDGCGEHSFVIKTWTIRNISSLRNNWRCKSVLAPYHATITLPKTSINVFEANIEGEDKIWLQSFPLILDRGLNDLSRRADQHKMDNSFINQLPVFTKDDRARFKTYIDRFWEVACRQFCNDHLLMKLMLFEKILPVFPEICTEDMKPRSREMEDLSIKGYITQLLHKFQPINQKELAKSSFESFAQHKKSIDFYFDEKKRLFGIAYGSNPTEQEWHVFFRHLHSGMYSKRLARTMIQDLRHFDMTKPNLTKYRDLLIRTAQEIMRYSGDGIYNKDDAKGCKSFGYSILSHITKSGHKQKGSANDPIVINQIDKSDQTDSETSSDDQSSSDDSSGSEQSGSESEVEESDQIQAVDGKKEGVCWFCMRAGHFMDTCYDKLNGRQHHPKGIWATKLKEKEKAKAAKNSKAAKAKKSGKKDKKKKGKKKGNIQQVEAGQTESDDNGLSPETIQYLQGIHDLGYLPLPLSDNEI
jgi:hypothetical protein